MYVLKCKYTSLKLYSNTNRKFSIKYYELKEKHRMKVIVKFSIQNQNNRSFLIVQPIEYILEYFKMSNLNLIVYKRSILF